jgi:hypothetical protein
MENKVKIINVICIFLSVAVVLVFRMETAQISYKVAQNYNVLRTQEAKAHSLSAVYEKEVGSERMVSEAEGMVALSSPANHQVVMIDDDGLAITR